MTWFMKIFSHFEQNISDSGWKFSTRMWTLQSPCRDEQLWEKHLFLGVNNQFHFFLFLRKKNLDIRRKKVRIVKSAFKVPGGRTPGKCFCGIVTILHNCSIFDGNTFKSSAKNSLVGSPNLCVSVRRKKPTDWFSLEPFIFILFAVFERNKSSRFVKTFFYVSRSICGNGVIFRSELFLKSFFATCTENLGFRLKLFNKLVNTAFYTFSGKNSGKVFSARIFFPMVNRLSAKSFPTFNRKLPIGCQYCMLRARGNNWGTFLKNRWTYLIILEIERQKLCDFKRKIPRTFLKTAFYVPRGKIWTIWFFVFVVFLGFWAGKIRQVSWNK